MKRLFTSTLLLVFLFACKNSTKSKDSNKSGDEKATTEKNITAVDHSINPANAYSDLFLDSATVQSFITSQHLNDTISRRLRSFNNSRNFQFAWFSGTGLTEQARAFWNLHNYYTTYSKDSSLMDKALKKKMDQLGLDEDSSLSAIDKSLVNTELKLTQHFFEYALKNFESGTVKRKELERFVPRKKEDALQQADSILTKKHKDNKYFEDVSRPYKLLKEQLKKYYDIAKSGGWQPVKVDVKKLKPGVSSPAVLAIKQRLQKTGEMPAGDTTSVFNDGLVSALKTLQQQLGYTPDGKLTAALIKEMNVPAESRVEQILINMNRMRWMPSEPEGNLIVVNIPEFMLYVYEGKKTAFDMKVVVGKEGHNTVMFTGNLNQVVFSPYWNITPDITKKEIVPGMKRNRNYLKSHHMEQVGTDGGVPVIRQLPGPDNSLGKVKFLFPNDYNIYFHDTPAKGLFEKDKRAYSHGCIRLSDPVKMANYLLRNNTEWTPEKIEEAMNSNTEKYVKVKNAVPVIITYYTAWVDDNGLLNFREDIYGHDKDLVKKMFVNHG